MKKASQWSAWAVHVNYNNIGVSDAHNYLGVTPIMVCCTYHLLKVCYHTVGVQWFQCAKHTPFFTVIYISTCIKDFDHSTSVTVNSVQLETLLVFSIAYWKRRIREPAYAQWRGLVWCTSVQADKSIRYVDLHRLQKFCFVEQLKFLCYIYICRWSNKGLL